MADDGGVDDDDGLRRASGRAGRRASGSDEREAPSLACLLLGAERRDERIGRRSRVRPRKGHRHSVCHHGPGSAVCRNVRTFKSRVQKSIGTEARAGEEVDEGRLSLSALGGILARRSGAEVERRQAEAEAEASP